MTSPIVWDPKVMPKLITMRYELIYVDVIIFVYNCFFYIKLILLFVINFNRMATSIFIWHAPYSSGVVHEDVH